MGEYPKFQINLDGEHGMFTVRAETYEELTRGILKVVGTETAAMEVMTHVKAGFKKLADGEMKGRGGGGFNRGGGFQRPAKVYTGPPCDGHNEPTERIEGKKGPFYACRAKIKEGTNAGDFAWKHGEGCKPKNIVE